MDIHIEDTKKRTLGDGHCDKRHLATQPVEKAIPIKDAIPASRRKDRASRPISNEKTCRGARTTRGTADADGYFYREDRRCFGHDTGHRCTMLSNRPVTGKTANFKRVTTDASADRLFAILISGTGPNGDAPEALFATRSPQQTLYSTRKQRPATTRTAATSSRNKPGF